MNNDLISRQALLEQLGLSEKTRKYCGDHSGYETMMLYEIQDVIESAPSVQPKEQTGHWTIIGKVFIPLFRGGYEHEFKYKCSECGFEHALPIPKNFCPNCGAKMEV